MFNISTLSFLGWLFEGGTRIQMILFAVYFLHSIIMRFIATLHESQIERFFSLSMSFVFFVATRPMSNWSLLEKIIFNWAFNWAAIYTRISICCCYSFLRFWILFWIIISNWRDQGSRINLSPWNIESRPCESWLLNETKLQPHAIRIPILHWNSPIRNSNFAFTFNITFALIQYQMIIFNTLHALCNRHITVYVRHKYKNI